MESGADSVTTMDAQHPTRPQHSRQRAEHAGVDDDVRSARRRMLRCAACGTAITDDARRIEISGAHRHVFVNPEGHVFEIGCFAAAEGVRPSGPASDFFSWFPGYAWRVAICAGCSVHLGWTYGDGPAFVGLILLRLVEDE
jgi:hypothetical protein